MRRTVNHQGAPKGDSKGEKPDPERTFSQVFADFRWFSARSVNQGIWESQICAENRRKLQMFAGNRRKPQIFAETGFSHLLSPFWRAPKPELSTAKQGGVWLEASCFMSWKRPQGTLQKGNLKVYLNLPTLKTLTSLNKEVRPFFLGDNSIWSFPSVSSLSDYSISRSSRPF